MRLSGRDAAGTLLTGVAALYGIAFLLGADVPAAPSTRVVALVVFGLGWGACVTGGSALAVEAHMTRPAVMLLSAIGVATLVVAVLAVVTASATMLAALLGLILGMWLLTTARHLAGPPREVGPPLHPAHG